MAIKPNENHFLPMGSLPIFITKLFNQYLITMKKNIFYYCLVLTGFMLVTTGCDDDAPVGDYFAEEQYQPEGTVITPSNVVNGFFDLGDLDNSFVSFDLAATGETPSSVAVLASYNGGGFVEVTSLSSLPATVTVTANDAISALGLNAGDIEVGDNVLMVFDSETGGATYRSNETLSVPFSCESDLAGTYDYEGYNYFCGDPGISGTLEIIETGAGTYTFDDWSFGSYPVCYGGSAASWGSLMLVDICNVISVTGVDNYGDSWELTINEVDGAVLDVTYSNTYGEFGSARIIRTDGSEWPPLSN